MESYSKERQIILAMQAIENNAKLSHRQAAYIYGAPKSTLCSRVHGVTSKPDSRNSRNKLTKFEENAIFQYVLDLDERGFPPRKACVEDMANLLLAKRDGARVGQYWVDRFISRQENLKPRLNRVYDFQRAVCEDPELIGAWFRLFQNMKAKYGIQDPDLYNFNETGFMMGVITAAMVVTRAD